MWWTHNGNEYSRGRLKYNIQKQQKFFFSILQQKQLDLRLLSEWKRFWLRKFFLHCSIFQRDFVTLCHMKDRSCEPSGNDICWSNRFTIQLMRTYHTQMFYFIIAIHGEEIVSPRYFACSLHETFLTALYIWRKS